MMLYSTVKRSHEGIKVKSFDMMILDTSNGFGCQPDGWRKGYELSLNLGNSVMQSDLYIAILGSYGIVISMDWLESHDAILNSKMKWLSLIGDEGQR